MILFEKRCKVTHFDFMLQIKSEIFMFFFVFQEKYPDLLRISFKKPQKYAV